MTPSSSPSGREWVTGEASATLDSPTLRAAGSGAKMCVDVEYLATSSDQALQFSGAAGRRDTPITTLRPDRVRPVFEPKCGPGRAPRSPSAPAG